MGGGASGMFSASSDPSRSLALQTGRFNLEEQRAMSPFRRQQAALGVQEQQLGLEAGRFRLGQERQLSPLQIEQAKLGLESGRFRFGQEQQMAPFQVRSAAASAGMGELGLERGQYEFGEFRQGAGLRAAERGLGEAQARVGLAAIGDVNEAGLRAYSLGLERENLERANIVAQRARAESEARYLPQMEAIRGGLMSRMAGMLGVRPPQVSPQASPTRSTMYPAVGPSTPRMPSWMQSYQTPSFPRR